MSEKSENEFLIEVLVGDIEAVEFCRSFYQITQVWDDLIDKDKPISDEAINRAFWNALVAIPHNGFYQQHFNSLLPLLQACIADWFDANELEKGPEHEKRVAYLLRDNASRLVVHCAYLVGGYEWGRKVSPQISKWIYDEPINEYTESLNEDT